MSEKQGSIRVGDKIGKRCRVYDDESGSIKNPCLSLYPTNGLFSEYTLQCFSKYAACWPRGGEWNMFFSSSPVNVKFLSTARLNKTLGSSRLFVMNVMFGRNCTNYLAIE